jgi:hypothetical protein
MSRPYDLPRPMVVYIHRPVCFALPPVNHLCMHTLDDTEGNVHFLTLQVFTCHLISPLQYKLSDTVLYGAWHRA